MDRAPLRAREACSSRFTSRATPPIQMARLTPPVIAVARRSSWVTGPTAVAVTAWVPVESGVVLPIDVHPRVGWSNRPNLRRVRAEDNQV